MQATWADHAPMFFARGGDQDYMMRSEKRPGQRPSGEGLPPRRRRKKPQHHVLYACLTLLLLVALYPIGLILLWVRKLRWSVGTKLLVSLVTGVIFFVLLAFALTTPIDNPMVTKWQQDTRGGLSHVVDVTRDAINNGDRIKENLVVHTPKALTMLKDLTLETAKQVVPAVQKNVQAVITRGPAAGLNAAKVLVQAGHVLTTEGRILPIELGEPRKEILPTPTGEPETQPTGELVTDPTGEPETQPSGEPSGEPTTEPTTAPAIAPVTVPKPVTGESLAATPIVTLSPTAEAGPEATGGVSPEPIKQIATPKPETSVREPEPPVMHTNAVLETPLAVLPTSSPVPTPTPTPAPTPIILPKPGDFSKITVYYYDESKGYHARPSCGNMHGAPAHTLGEAALTGKKACSACKPPQAALLEAALPVWCGTDDVFHIDGACPALTEKWVGRPFEEAWLEDSMTGCPLCGAALYVEDRKRTPEPTPVPAQIDVTDEKLSPVKTPTQTVTPTRAATPTQTVPPAKTATPTQAATPTQTVPPAKTATPTQTDVPAGN
ncbi:MAG: hypothetical protein RR893_08915 [Clostridia bacterium]